MKWGTMTSKGLVQSAILGIAVFITSAYGALSFSDDFEGSGNPDFYALDLAKNYSGVKSDDFSRTGSQSFKFTLYQSDPEVHNSKRAEIAKPLSHRYQHTGEAHWYAFSTYLPENYQYDPSFEIIAQWHSSPDSGEEWRSPPLSLQIRGDKFVIINRWDSRLISPDGNVPEGLETLYVDDVDKGRWVDWVFYMAWDYDNSGALKVYRDGVLIVDKSGRPNCYNDPNIYMKMGIYKPHYKYNPDFSTTTSRVLYHDAVKIGDNYNEVALTSVKNIDTTEIVASDDAYVRGGNNASANYNSHGLAIKNSPNSTYTRESFLKFDVRDIRDTIVAAKLVLSLNDGDGYQGYLHFSSQDNWNESTLTYNNKPGVSGDALNRYVVDGNTMELDVTDIVQSENNGDGWVTLRLSGDEDKYFSFYDSENSSSSLRPRLVITTRNADILRASHDAYIRGSSYANENYGNEDHLVLKAAHNDKYVREAIIKFNVSYIDYLPKKVQLRLTLDSDGTGSGIKAHSIWNDSWYENSVTWNNTPNSGAELGSANINGSPGSYIYLDLDTSRFENIAEDDMVSILITSTEDAYDQLRSSEYPTAWHRPTLLIE